jgi:biotin carboxyl carrier protein
LKIPNEITTRVAGRVEELLVTEGQGVEYGQPLLIIHPEDA